MIENVEIEVKDLDVELDQSSGGVAVSEKVIETTEVERDLIIVVKGGKIYGFFKRIFDIFCSLLAIIVLSPILIIIGLLVKTTSRGPMLYVSTRIGKNGKEFKFYKFRSMKKDADKELEGLLDQNETQGITFKMQDDPRITKFGKFIRKTSLDELPQLFNILKGDMSIVGPRPCTDREYKLYSEKDKKRLLVPQGLTGEWQTRGRSNTTFDEMVNMDLEYITAKRGFWYDIWLIIKTVFVVFKKEGAK